MPVDVGLESDVMVIVREQGVDRPLAHSPEYLRPLLQLCREGRLYDVEHWIAEGKPLQLAPEAIRKGTRPKTALQVASRPASIRLVRSYSRAATGSSSNDTRPSTWSCRRGAGTSSIF